MRWAAWPSFDASIGCTYFRIKSVIYLHKLSADAVNSPIVMPRNKHKRTNSNLAMGSGPSWIVIDASSGRHYIDYIRMMRAYTRSISKHIRSIGTTKKSSFDNISNIFIEGERRKTEKKQQRRQKKMNMEIQLLMRWSKFVSLPFRFLFLSSLAVSRSNSKCSIFDELPSTVTLQIHMCHARHAKKNCQFHNSHIVVVVVV